MNTCAVADLAQFHDQQYVGVYALMRELMEAGFDNEFDNAPIIRALNEEASALGIYGQPFVRTLYHEKCLHVLVISPKDKNTYSVVKLKVLDGKLKAVSNVLTDRVQAPSSTLIPSKLILASGGVKLSYKQLEYNEVIQALDGWSSLIPERVTRMVKEFFLTVAVRGLNNQIRTDVHFKPKEGTLQVKYYTSGKCVADTTFPLK